ncbi:MAG: hypothetical protein ACI4GW_12295 [Lachnospiraceae bacterium]
MREQLKKPIAIIIVVILVLTLIQTPMDVRAETIILGVDVDKDETIYASRSNDYTVPNGATLTIADGGSVSGSIIVSNGGKLDVKKGGSVSGNIEVSRGGKLIVQYGGSVSGRVEVKDTGNDEVEVLMEIANHGNINEVFVNGGTIYNERTIDRIELDSDKDSLTNEGTIQTVIARKGSVKNERYASIATLTVGGANITNSGTVTQELSVGSTDTTITMSGTSVIEKFSVGSGPLVITSDVGAIIKNATLRTDNFNTGSSGTVTVTDSLSLDGDGTFPLTFNVDSSTKITKKTDNSGWSVNCDGKKYILPASTFTDKSLSDMYKAVFSESSIALPDLTVQYAVADVTGETFTISNGGISKIRWKLSNIPEFVELYDATTALSKDGTITLPEGESKTITVKAKSGLSVNEYSGSISFDVYTAEGATTADDTLMTTKDIPVTLKVNRKEGSGTIEVNDVYYGTPVTCTVSSTTNDEGETVEFKKRDASDDTYTTELPTEVGEYTARATFAQTNIYEEYVATADFAILRKEGSGTVTVDDIYYGETIKPVVISITNGNDNVTYEYKEKGAGDETYTATKPTLVGEYTVRATFAQTPGYNAVTATDDFKISRITGSGTITVSDIHYGETVSPVPASATNGTDNVTYEYKVKGAADTTYTKTVPTKVGTYTVRATFAQTDIYNAVTATDDFEITYLKAPESPYSMSGKQGSNGYYTSKVIITPAEGYLIAEALDGNYRENLTVNQYKDKYNIYLKKIATGEKTSAIQIPVIKIDMTSPAILNAGSGEKLYGEQVEIKVKDDNLVQVLVNGEEVKFKNNMAILKLSSNLGEETYEIICTDVAGNTSKTKVVVAADWMKDKIIPVGSAVRLSTEYSYQLGGGTWHVEGDDTSYAGNTTFYVASEGEYIFTKIGE